MLPGKVYTPDELFAIGWRYRWVVVLPTVLLAVMAAGVSRLIPNRYRSETVVLVVPQRVPESYVRSTVTTRIEDRVRSIREQILSRSRLERIIEELNLYAVLRQRLPMEMVVERMRHAVSTRVVRDDAFSVSYIADTPENAQRVTQRLASMFSEENMRDREVLAESTNQFLQTQLDDARRELSAREEALEAYRRQHAGELPEQVTSNLQVIQNAEVQIQTLVQSLNADRERQLLQERQLADANTLQVTATLPPTQPPGVLTTIQQLDAAESSLRVLETRLRPEHPDLVQARLAVERLREKSRAEQSGVTVDNDRASSVELARQNRVAEIRAQLESTQRLIDRKLAEEARLRDLVTAYRAKVEAAPRRETELVSLNRDYETLQAQYRGLLAKFAESKVAANMERRQIGEQFRILDPAQIPERPFKPNRLLIVAGGAGAGLAIGLALSAFLAFRDRTLRSAGDVALCCALHVVAALPVIQSRVERQRAKRRSLVAWTLSVIAIAVAGVMAFLLGNRIVNT